MSSIGRIPWDGVFWATVLGLFGCAAVFAYSAETSHALRLGLDGESANLEEGDAVKVVLILNGDEVVVEKDGLRAIARMVGIESFDPVVNEREITAYGHSSVAFLRRWLLDKKVTVSFTKPQRDEKGRYLVYFNWNNVDINQRMVEEGISMVYTEFPHARESSYLETEQAARALPSGVWAGRKARLRITGLRREWQVARRNRGDSTLVDPLLEDVQ